MAAGSVNAGFCAPEVAWVVPHRYLLGYLSDPYRGSASSHNKKTPDVPWEAGVQILPPQLSEFMVRNLDTNARVMSCGRPEHLQGLSQELRAWLRSYPPPGASSSWRPPADRACALCPPCFHHPLAKSDRSTLRQIVALPQCSGLHDRRRAKIALPPGIARQKLEGLRVALAGREITRSRHMRSGSMHPSIQPSRERNRPCLPVSDAVDFCPDGEFDVLVVISSDTGTSRGCSEWSPK